jgi:hypothetical protein
MFELAEAVEPGVEVAGRAPDREGKGKPGERPRAGWKPPPGGRVVDPHDQAGGKTQARPKGGRSVIGRASREPAVAKKPNSLKAQSDPVFSFCARRPPQLSLPEVTVSYQ